MSSTAEGSSPGQHTAFSQPSPVHTLSQPSLIFMTLMFLWDYRTAVWQNVPQFMLGVSLWLDSIRHFRKKYHGDNCCALSTASHEVAQGVSLSITGSVHFDHSRKVVSARLLHWTVTVHLYFSKCVIWRYFETANILFLIKSLPISFSIYWCFLPEWIITKMVAKWWFSNDIISCAFVSIRLYYGLLFFPFIICICDLRFPFYSVVYNHYCRCFDAQVVPGFTIWLRPYSWLLCFTLDDFLTFWHSNIFQALLLSVSRPWNSPFLQGVLAPFPAGCT